MQEHNLGLMIIGNADEKPSKEIDYIQTFKQNNVMGIISATNPEPIQLYENLPFPVVFLDRTTSNQPSVFADGLDEEKRQQEIIEEEVSRLRCLEDLLNYGQHRIDSKVQLMSFVGQM